MIFAARSAALWAGVTGVYTLAALTPLFAVGGVALATGAALFTQRAWCIRRYLIGRVYRAGYRAGYRDAEKD